MALTEKPPSSFVVTEQRRGDGADDGVMESRSHVGIDFLAAHVGTGCWLESVK